MSEKRRRKKYGEKKNHRLNIIIIDNEVLFCFYVVSRIVTYDKVKYKSVLKAELPWS